MAFVDVDTRGINLRWFANGEDNYHKFMKSIQHLISLSYEEIRTANTRISNINTEYEDHNDYLSKEYERHGYEAIIYNEKEFVDVAISEAFILVQSRINAICGAVLNDRSLLSYIEKVIESLPEDYNNQRIKLIKKVKYKERNGISIIEVINTVANYAKHKDGFWKNAKQGTVGILKQMNIDNSTEDIYHKVFEYLKIDDTNLSSLIEVTNGWASKILEKLMIDN
jgi:flagellar biosynthesis chaperone FliJ